MKKLSILIPMYNEENYVKNTAYTLSQYFGKIFAEDEYEIVFCNDGSTDRSTSITESLDIPEVRTVGYSDNRGKGSAIRYGISACEGEYIVCTDCDLAYGCDAIMGMYNELLSTKCDLVIGSRNLEKDGYHGYTLARKLMSKAYIKVISVLAGFSYTDSQCGIKAYKTESARSIFRLCSVNGFAYDLEVLILADKLGLAVREKPVKILNHAQSTSKVKPLRDSFKMIADVIKIRRKHKNVSSDS